ncbi:beta-1,3-galactosyltransferase brn-like [Galendromus occidentalis]|uniref:Hexosyltransferase n=1 Tax=Galendromus occidentalis TaxID=34638 RepID=A0AAJ7WK99_9ACAR|nr:beta-1,3-galactosyltransferase brn-like [Galendromus occidentalis]
MGYDRLAHSLGPPKMGPRQLRRLAALLAMFVFSVVALDQFGIFLKLGETFSLDPGYDYPMRGDQFDDMLPVNHIYDSLEYRIHNNTSCKNDFRLTIFVKSALAHRSRRNVIRRTWGKKRFSNTNMATFFMIARGSEESDLVVENEKHKDIIQVDFIDAYYNNTLKTMASMRWASQFCRKTQYFLFIDDDYYLSVKNLLRYIDVFEAESGGALYAGELFPNAAPMRHRFSKWFISLRDYAFSRYPPYITAGAILLNQEALQKVYTASKFTRHFKFDDIFVGICARKARVQPTHSEFIQMWPQYGNLNLRDVIAAHGFVDSALEELWNEAYKNKYA